MNGSAAPAPNFTKIIYYLDDEETPYSVKAAIPYDEITLRDFKALLQLAPKTSYKFYFKVPDDDLNMAVKEELFNDDDKLPKFMGRVVSWVVPADGSSLSVSSSSQVTEISRVGHGHIRGVGVGARAPEIHSNYVHPMSHHGYGRNRHDSSYDDSTTCTESESVVSSHCERYPKRYQSQRHRCHAYETESESTSYIDSDDEDTSDHDDDTDDIDVDESASRIESASTTTADTSVSRIQYTNRRRRNRMPIMSNGSSVSSSMTGSTVSRPLITVTLNIDSPKAFLGISLSELNGKIFVANILAGGVAAKDGRIEPGDQLIAVNDLDMEALSSAQAAEVLRQARENQGPVKLVLRKGWDSNPKGYFTIQRSEPVRPIDPGAWVAHTEAACAMGGSNLRPPSVSAMTSIASSVTGSIADSERLLALDQEVLRVEDGLQVITKAMAAPDSGLDIRDREWLKIRIPHAFLGSDLVDWLLTHVQGLPDRKHAKKFANEMLRQKLIKNKPIDQKSFNEKCYYGFGDTITHPPDMIRLRLDDDAQARGERVTLMGINNHSSPWHGQNHKENTFSSADAAGASASQFWTSGNEGVVQYGLFSSNQPSGELMTLPLYLQLALST